jgi:CHAD domain-containing protein
VAKAREVRIDPQATFREAARCTVAVRGPELLEFRAGTLLGADIEELHSMRVASRRLRAALEVYADCFPPAKHRRLLRLVKDTADALSEARDLDVMIDFLAGHAAEVGVEDQPGIESLISLLRDRRTAADDHLAPALRRLDQERFLDQVQALLKGPTGMNRDGAA